ncbi:unnamed protein product, partial [Mesorhabditis belari]|uniref:Uncharacterized protein n=1 Tax=Mesorhabditis belari TaxID=2138241 RepID=A0AAF3FP37_9BILA
MEITCNNFKEIYRDLENVVKRRPRLLASFDDLAKFLIKYRKQRASVQRFPPIQLGIAFFTAHDSGFKAVNELAGASDIVMAIIENRLPIIGHNCLFDLLYLYSTFYCRFCLMTTRNSKKLRLPFSRLSSTQRSWRKKAKIEAPSRLGTFPTFEYSHTDFRLLEGASRRNKYKRTTFHNAAYDALVTGQAFVKLGHLIAKPSGNPSPLPFRTLLYTVPPICVSDSCGVVRQKSYGLMVRLATNTDTILCLVPTPSARTIRKAVNLNMVFRRGAMMAPHSLLRISNASMVG